MENIPEIPVMKKINYSKNTVGCNVGGEIFIHPELYKYPKLYQAVIDHEKRHTARITKDDIAIDMFNDELKDSKREFYKFMLTHPRTFLGFLPVTKIGKTWAFDLELAVAWFIALGMAYFIGVNL